MLCKVCGKDFDSHDQVQVMTCLQKGFNVNLAHAHDALAPYHLVVEKAQPGADKHYFELRLSDGTKIETWDLDQTYAMLLLTQCYERPKLEVKSFKQLPREDQDELVMPPLPSERRPDQEDAGSAENDGVGTPW